MFSWKKALPVLIQLLIAGIVVYFVAANLPLKFVELLDYLKHTGYLFYSSLALFTIFLSLQAGIWVLILNDTGRQLTMRQGLTVFINSQFAKYIPGGIWNYAGRVVLASRHGVSLASQTTALLYENVLLILAAFLYSLVVIVDAGMASWPVVVLIAGLLLVFFVFYTPLFAAFGKGLRTLLGKFPLKRFTSSLSALEVAMPRNRFFLYLGCFLASHFVMGVAFWLLLRSFGVFHVNVFFAAGTFAAAWLLGMLSPLPGGLGVREGFLVYFLSYQMDTTTALQISVIARVWNIMSEILFFLVLNGMNLVFSSLRPRQKA
ncbi:lysylphosphatidylglycerol synthase transmembrane domain-containing protein [Paenibacillus cymbidii]|uniref:lysylphosphatidylglycerol synthase transmembrane domain-containing protein n=1 Tax=Paenibacillus cymbidii TaxID=1639034 RepID=UPI001080CB59|nr:lysylphosphatidylglycerol synthase domain-containing protein [Paenibacillus cymbidii]